MAWTAPTAIFFVALAMTLSVMTWLALAYPEAERVGILRIPTTRGDRLFVALIVTAIIHLLWIGLVGTDTIATLPIEMAHGVPAVAATISDGRTAIGGRFAVDTGTAAVRLSSKLAMLRRTPPDGVDAASRLDPPARLFLFVHVLAGNFRSVRQRPRRGDAELAAGTEGGCSHSATVRVD